MVRGDTDRAPAGAWRMMMTRYLVGLLALLVMVSGKARADTRVLVDLYPEWQVREVCRIMEREGDLPARVDVTGDLSTFDESAFPEIREWLGDDAPLYFSEAEGEALELRGEGPGGAACVAHTVA